MSGNNGLRRRTKMPLDVWRRLNAENTRYEAGEKAAWMTKPGKVWARGMERMRRPDRLNLAAELRRRGFYREARAVLMSPKRKRPVLPG